MEPNWLTVDSDCSWGGVGGLLTDEANALLLDGKDCCCGGGYTPPDGPNIESRSSAGGGLCVGAEDESSKSMRDSSFLVDEAANSDGIGFAAATKSPFLNDSYRFRTVFI